MSKITKPCICCDRSERPDWVDDPRRAETWFWIECGTCGGVVCSSCREIDDNGIAECIDCASTAVHCVA